jgi:hypothetical protein
MLGACKGRNTFLFTFDTAPFFCVCPVHITVNGNNQKGTKTENMAIKYRLNQEVKCLYKKKATLNQQLYNAHLGVLVRDKS